MTNFPETCNIQSHSKAFTALDFHTGATLGTRWGLGVGFHHLILHKEHSRYIGTAVQLAGTHPLCPLITVWGRHYGARHDFHKGNLKGICNFQPATFSQSTCSPLEKFKQYFLFLIHFCFISLPLLQAQHEQNKSIWLRILYNSENWLELDSKNLISHFNDEKKQWSAEVTWTAHVPSQVSPSRYHNLHTSLIF